MEGGADFDTVARGGYEFNRLVYDKLREFLCKERNFRQIPWDKYKTYSSLRYHPFVVFLWDVERFDGGIAKIDLGLQGSHYCFSMNAIYAGNNDDIRRMLRRLLDVFAIDENDHFINR